MQFHSTNNKGEEKMETQTATTTETTKPKRASKKRKGTKKAARKTAAKKTAKQKARTGTKKSKITGPSVAFNVSVPASLLPKIDKKAATFAKKNNLSRVSRSAFVRQTLIDSIR